ncbi:MAG: aminotransferase class V-fold PLP-dependent enzyme [Myxococcales bacterium]|nr:aminotransferase class V-fold PLP-dependent enzyme [Myxococcales bacterium]
MSITAPSWVPRLSPRLGDRSGFPTLAARAYLAHCAISPPSTAVRAAADMVLDDYAREGVSAFMTWHERREELRLLLAELIGAGPNDLGFVANTTTGVATIALCFPWQPGDVALVLRGEFPTNVTPWQRAAALHGLRLEFLDVEDFAGPAGTGLQKLEERLRAGGVRLIAVSAVQFQTGLRMPIREMATLAHAHGAQLFCDAIQAVGVLDLDVAALGVDYLAAGSHKWLMGLEGCAMLYVSPERVAELRPHTAGWLSHEHAIDFLFAPDQLRYDRPIRRRADFVEGGAYPTTLLAGLQASASALAELGIGTIETHVHAYLDRLEAGLRERGFVSLRSEVPAQRSGILTVRPPEGRDVFQIYAGLSERGIVTSIPEGLLRMAPHWPNALAEVDTVLAVFDEVLAAPPED